MNEEIKNSPTSRSDTITRSEDEANEAIFRLTTEITRLNIENERLNREVYEKEILRARAERVMFEYRRLYQLYFKKFTEK